MYYNETDFRFGKAKTGMTAQKIVLVQDESAPFQVLKAALAKNGLDVTTCTTAFDAIGEMRSAPGALVITSVKLPDLSGFHLSSLLKTADSTRYTPVVVIGTREELADNFWRRASLSDLVLERAEVEFNEEKALHQIKALLSLPADKRETNGHGSESAQLPANLNGQDTAGGYRELTSLLLMERSVNHFCRELVEHVGSRVEFMSRFFGYTRRLFGTDLTGLLVADPQSPWGIYELDSPVSKSAFEKLQTTVGKELGSSAQPRLLVNGDVADKGGASLKSAGTVVVHGSDGKVLGVLALGWFAKHALDESAQQLLEMLRTEMQPVFRALMAAQEIQVLREAQTYSSSIDPVTGLYNLEFFIGFLQQQLLFSSRQKLPVGVTLIGIDHFTELNESFGPQAGDTVLSTVARRISTTIRSSDLLARYSGDQFAVVLPNTDTAGSQILAEKLRAEVENIPWDKINGKSPKVTVSVGCASFKQDDVNPETILRDAKMALQNAKNSGRNRVAV